VVVGLFQFSAHISPENAASGEAWIS